MRSLHLPIANPCHEDWDAMDRVERGRFCQVCTKQVHDLSSMTETEARQLLREESGQRICVRYRHDGEGRVQFRVLDSAPPAVASPVADTCTSPRRAGWMGATMLATAMAACTPHDNPDVPKPRFDPVEVVEMGEVAMQTVPDQTIVEVVPAPVEIREVKGEMVAIEPPPPPVTHVVMGDMPAEPLPVEATPAEPCPGPEARPEREDVVMGKMERPLRALDDPRTPR